MQELIGISPSVLTPMKVGSKQAHLTHSSWDKMAVILQMTLFWGHMWYNWKRFFGGMWYNCKCLKSYKKILWQLRCKLIHCGIVTPHGFIELGSTLVQVMAWCLKTPSHYLSQGWGQIRFIKYKYKYKYKNLDFSNTNTNTNIFLKFDSNTNTNTLIQIQIQIRSTKYICRKLFGSKTGQFYKSQDICSWSVFPPNV